MAAQISNGHLYAKTKLMLRRAPALAWPTAVNPTTLRVIFDSSLS